MQYPHWLEILAVVSLALAGASALVILIDVLQHRQHMWIMNVVWPVTGLYFGSVALWMYFKWGRLTTHHRVMQAKQSGGKSPGKQKPFWQISAIGSLHCGSGCTLGDIVAEWVVFFFPFTLFGKKIFGTWVLDYGLAFLFGIAFQYFSIKPMKDLPPGKGLMAAVKADTLSLSSWQLGMYGWMALATFAIFGHELEKTSPVFWFMMQIAMWLGFLTSYPVNWWLIKKGIKEKM